MTAAPLADAVTVRDAIASDALALHALHRAGFGSRWSIADWRHRYGGLPERARVVGAFDRAGACLAAFGGVLLPCRLGDRTGIACRGGDVAVDPRLRSTAAGPRLLLRVCEAFADGFLGSDTALIFGFPSPGLARTLTRQCRFEVMGDVVWLTRPVAGSPGPEAAPVTVTRELPPGLDALLADETGPAALGLVRDLGYLRWRYEQDPLGDYVVAMVRSAAGTPRGAVIVRCDSPHPEAVVVVEWFVPPDDADAVAALLAAVDTIARTHRRRHVVTCFAGSAPAFGTLQREHGFRVVVSPYQFVFRSYTQAVTRRTLFEHWRLSAGDLDFL